MAFGEKEKLVEKAETQASQKVDASEKGQVSKEAKPAEKKQVSEEAKPVEKKQASKEAKPTEGKQTSKEAKPAEKKQVSEEAKPVQEKLASEEMAAPEEKPAADAQESDSAGSSVSIQMGAKYECDGGRSYTLHEPGVSSESHLCELDAGHTEALADWYAVNESSFCRQKLQEMISHYNCVAKE